MVRQSQRVRQRSTVQQVKQKPTVVQETLAVTQTQTTIGNQTAVAQPTAQLVTQKQSLESTKLVVYSSVCNIHGLVEQRTVLTIPRSAASPTSGIHSFLYILAS
jgi:desulfoferrodoxin (superoxide reductase-like protein)